MGVFGFDMLTTFGNRCDDTFFVDQFSLSGIWVTIAFRGEPLGRDCIACAAGLDFDERSFSVDLSLTRSGYLDRLVDILISMEITAIDTLRNVARFAAAYQEGSHTPSILSASFALAGGLAVGRKTRGGRGCLALAPGWVRNDESVTGAEVELLAQDGQWSHILFETASGFVGSQLRM